MLAGFRQAVATTAVFACLCALPAAALADGYNQPTAIANNTLFTQTSGAGVEANEPLTAMGEGVCDTGGPEIANTRWYSFRGTGGPMYMTSSGSDFDTVIGVYEGPAPAPFGASLFCSNDRGDNDADSQVELSSTEAGKEYLLQIGGCNDDLNPGACPFDVPQGTTGIAAFAAVGNDSRSFPETVPAATPVTRTNAGASTEGGESTTCAGATLGKSVWFRYNATAAGRARFEAVGFDVVLGVHRGGKLACNDDTGDANTSEVSLDVTPGAYLVQIGGKGAGEAAFFGNFRYRVDFTAAPTPTPIPTPTPGPVDLDRDNDGLNDDLDCDDDNPKRRQGLPEIRGNQLDEDCDGRAQDFLKVGSKARLGYLAAASTQLKQVVVSRIAAGSTVRITCKGKGCGRKKYTRRFRKAARRFDFARAMRRNRPRPGAVIEIRITKPQRIGVVYRYRFRFYKIPREIDDLCLRPGSKTVKACP